MISIRKIGVLGRTYRHLNRYRQILTIFIKYGFGDLLETLKIEQYIEFGMSVISRNRRERLEKLTRAERLRMAMEELGPTYIKLGQILSSRPDLVAVEFINEFAKLQDKVTPFSFSTFKDSLETELHGDIDTFFAFVDPEPLASASIGQVHRARLHNGEEVVIKVCRPGIAKIVEVDLEIMLHLATLAERHIEEIAFHQPVRIVEEFALTLAREMDYTIEASSMERVANQFLAEPNVYIPKVYREFTTKRVLTTEFIDGIKISDTQRLLDVGLNCRHITELGADILLKQIFVHGFFHGDPHPGNIFVLPKSGAICLIDFGMMGMVSRSTREMFVNLADSLMQKDEAGLVQYLLKLTDWDDEPNMMRLEKDVAEFIGRNLFKPLSEIRLTKVIHQLLELTAKHCLRIPPDIFLMLKALAQVDGIARNLHPEFDIFQETIPFIRRIKIARISPGRIRTDVMKLAEQGFEFLVDFPKDLLEISRSLRKKNLSLNLVVKDLDKILATHDQISNRISFAIIIAALIIGSALIVISNMPPLLYGISLIGLIGFLAAGVLGVWLLVAIIKKGRL